MRQIVLDTETTGLSPETGDRIIEIGCVELHSRKLTGNDKHFYLNPERQVHEDALKVHGLSDEFLAGQPKFAAIAGEFLEYIAGAEEVIIHNAAFDLAFLDAELARLGMPAFAGRVGRVVDTLAMAKEAYPGKRNSLDALCERLGVDNASRTLHGALLDAQLLAEVYVNMTRGQESLLEEQGGSGPGGPAVRMDLSEFALPVLWASEAELASHEAVLAGIDKDSGRKTVWRMEGPAP